LFRLLVAVAALVVVAAGCGPGAVTQHVTNGRFTVTISAKALRRARTSGISLRQVVTTVPHRDGAAAAGAQARADRSVRMSDARHASAKGYCLAARITSIACHVAEDPVTIFHRRR